jgi:hypothetical protein
VNPYDETWLKAFVDNQSENELLLFSSSDSDIGSQFSIQINLNP